MYYNDTNKKNIPAITKGILTSDERIMIMDKLDKLQNDEHIMSEVDA